MRNTLQCRFHFWEAKKSVALSPTPYCCCQRNKSLITYSRYPYIYFLESVFCSKLAEKILSIKNCTYSIISVFIFIFSTEVAESHQITMLKSSCVSIFGFSRFFLLRKLQARDILEQIGQLSEAIWRHQVAHSLLLDLTRKKSVWSVRCMSGCQIYLGKWGWLRLWMYIFSWFVKGLDSLECLVSKLKPSVVVVLIRFLYLSCALKKVFTKTIMCLIFILECIFFSVTNTYHFYTFNRVALLR